MNFRGAYICYGCFQLVFEMLLVETFDMDLLEMASACFYALICCHQVTSVTFCMNCFVRQMSLMAQWLRRASWGHEIYSL